MSGLPPGGYCGTMATTSDPDLLREFSEKRSETAFDSLVRRHLDLVHSAAFRLTGNAHQAEDVTQAVFVALARHATEVARKVSHGAPLSAWLHVTTRNLASKLIRTESRRRARERESVTMNDLPSLGADATWESIAPHLDHSLADLSESDRNVVLLRFFERKTAREIGGLLGIGEDAAQKRISRAVDRLCHRSPKCRQSERVIAGPGCRGIWEGHAPAQHEPPALDLDPRRPWLVQPPHRA